MTHSRRFWAASALLLAGVFVAGVAAKPASTPPVNIGVSGTAGQIFQPDPKLPGKFLWKLYVQGATGAAQDNGFQGKLTGVTAILYQHGTASALMTAPTANGNSTSQVIVATGPGRIKVRSLTEKGTTLEADKMTWYARTNKIIAIGNVVYRKGLTGAMLRVPYSPVNADTRLHAVSFGKGSATLP